MEKQTHPLDFVFQNGRVAGPLRHGVTIEGTVHKSFELREATVEDLLDAESEADVTKPLAFNAQLLVRQLIRLGSYEGPFTINMIKRMKPVDWRILRAAQTEVDAMGEGGPASAPAS